ncbi:MAG: LytTR family DNA-binding domain-containing protein [Rhodothermia bacterium]|nr:MAG: LytTR family DNA-binding domain-containing protein [Rhodothermia bacterium]
MSSKTLRLLVVDDEPPARKRLKKMLMEVSTDSDIEIVGEATDGVEAVEMLKKGGIDVLFLDVQMPGYDGFEVLDRIEPDVRPVVVFTTAFDEYAIRAFEANAVDYLLKPIPKDRLEEALRRAAKLRDTPDSKNKTDERMARLLDWMDARSVIEAESESYAESDGPLKQLSIPYRDRILIIPIEQLVSVEISEGITRVFILEDESDSPRPKLKQHIVSYTLDQLGGLLDSNDFIRVHRSAIVQFAHIRELVPWFSGRYKLILTANHEVIASRERSKLLKERLMI